MSCRPEHVTAYVDGELEPDVRAEIESHLESCGACSRQADDERALRRRLRTELPSPELPAGLDHAVRRRLRAWRGPRPLQVLLPLAAVLVFAFAWGRANAAFLGLQLSRDHAHCFGLAELPAEVFASHVEPVAAWFEERGTPLPPLPSAAAGLELAGARYCTILDRQVAHLYYTQDGRRLSVFVVPEPVRLQDRYAGHALGRRVRMLRLAGQALAIVADKPSDADAFARSFDTLVADAGWRPAPRAPH